jgi:hypothetical protein
MSKKNIFLCSFASPDLFVSKIRFKNQLDKFNYYKEYKIFSYGDIPNEAKNFIQLCRKDKDLRGYGYWIWKPLIIKKYLETLPDNAILHYCDIGSVFNNHNQTKKNILDDLADKCLSNNIIAFDYSKPINLDPELSYKILYEYQFTKNDLFQFYKINKDSNIYNSPQYSAGSFFIKKSSFSKEFIEKWLEPFRKSKKLVDNSKSSEEHNEFIEHRHDQSIFSILCKLNNIYTLSVYDYFEHSYFYNIPYWENIVSSPLHHKRNLRYISTMKIINYFKRKLFK